MCKNPFDDYNEEEMFSFQIWELDMMISVGTLHLETFKQKNKNFKTPNKRVKGTDTIFYETNLPDWIKMLEKSLKQYEKDYEQEYTDERVRFPKGRRSKTANIG